MAEANLAATELLVSIKKIFLQLTPVEKQLADEILIHSVHARFSPVQGTTRAKTNRSSLPP